MGIIRTAEALGVGRIYVIDKGKLKLPNDWQKMRDDPQFLNLSASGCCVAQLFWESCYEDFKSEFS